MHAPHDQFAKRVLEQLLDPFGRVFLEFVVAATDDQRFDLWFEPLPDAPPPCPDHLRLIRRMARGPCAIEPFSCTPGPLEVRQCHRKQLNWQHLRERGARKEQAPLPSLFPLWVLSPGRPLAELERRRARRARGWPQGFYFTDEASQLWLVALSELPTTRETLLLRLLGAGPTRGRALEELQRLPAQDPGRADLLRLVSVLRLAVARDTTIEEKEREEFMTNAMLELQELESVWRNQGAQRATARAILTILKARSVAVSDEQRRAILACEDEAALQRWLTRAATATTSADLG